MRVAKMHADSIKGGFARHSGVRSRGTRCDSRVHLLAVPIAPAVKVSGRYSLSTRCPFAYGQRAASDSRQGEQRILDAHALPWRALRAWKPPVGSLCSGSYSVHGSTYLPAG